MLDRWWELWEISAQPYKNQKLNIIRPLLDIEKKDLIYISKKVFNFYIKDPSNINKEFKRTRIRNLLQSLEKEGLDKKKPHINH